MKSFIKSNFFSLGILIGVSLLLISVTNHYILTINFFDNSGDYLSGNPSAENDVYNALQKYIYLSAVVYLVFKLIVTALIIYTAMYLAGHQIEFRRAYKIVVLAEYLFLLPVIIKIIWFKVEYPLGTVTDWHKVYIFSALSLIGDVSPDWYYPLQTLNLFEVGYWFLLAYGIKKTTSLNFDQSLRMVLFSYVPALFIWVVTVAFCTVMVFPQNA